MRTVDGRCNDAMQSIEIQDDADSDTMVNLQDAISSKEDLGQKRFRRLSLSALVIDLAFAVGRRLSESVKVPCVPQAE